MGAIASQITSLTIVYSAVYSDADQRKHQSSAPLAFVRWFTGEFPAQMASNAENVSSWWRHHVLGHVHVLWWRHSEAFIYHPILAGFSHSQHGRGRRSGPFFAHKVVYIYISPQLPLQMVMLLSESSTYVQCVVHVPYIEKKPYKIHPTSCHCDNLPWMCWKSVNS